jgi:tetratricopeptide (TPR) repeat protein
MKQTACVCAVIIAFGAGTACIATKQTYLSRGNKFYDAGKYADASLNYQKAIQKDPKFGEAYYRLGLADIKQNQAREAYYSLYRAVQLLPDRTDVTEKFADVSLSYYLADSSHPEFLYKQIKQISNELLSKNPNSYEGRMLEGYLAQTDRQPKKAIESFRKALQVDSSNAGVTTELVRLLIQDGQTEEAFKLAGNVMAQHKDYGPIYDVMYTFYDTGGRVAEAENVLKTKVSNNPKQADYVLQLARYYARLQKPREMTATLQHLVTNTTDFPEGRVWVGDFYLGAKNFPEALRAYREGLSATKDARERSVYQKRAIVALRAQGDEEGAFELAARVVKENPKDDEATHLHADLAVEIGKPANGELAVREFQTLLKHNPNDASLELQLGRAYRLNGDLPKAIVHFRAAITKRKVLVEPRLELADIDLAQRQFDEALQQINDALRLQPNSPRGRLLHARILMATGYWKDTRIELTNLLKDSPNYNEAKLETGVLAILEKRYPDAIEIFGKLRDVDPRASAGLATVYASQGQTQKAADIITEALKKWPDALVLLEQMAAIRARNGNYDAAIGQLRQLLDKDPKSVETMQRLGEMYEAKGDHGQAISSYQRALELAPTNIDIGLTLADTLALAGRNAEAKQHYEGLLKLYPDNPGALNNLAFFLADSGGDLDEALRLAQRALAKVPNQPAFSDTVGYIYLKKGLTDAAMRTFGSVVRKNPELAAFHYHLGLAMIQKGEKAAARKELESALKLSTLTPQDKVRVTELLAKIG